MVHFSSFLNWWLKDSRIWAHEFLYRVAVVKYLEKVVLAGWCKSVSPRLVSILKRVRIVCSTLASSWSCVSAAGVFETFVASKSERYWNVCRSDRSGVVTHPVPISFIWRQEQQQFIMILFYRFKFRVCSSVLSSLETVTSYSLYSVVALVVVGVSFVANLQCFSSAFSPLTWNELRKVLNYAAPAVICHHRRLQLCVNPVCSRKRRSSE